MLQSYWIFLFFLVISKLAPKCCDELSNPCKKVSRHEVSFALGSDAKLPCSVPVHSMKEHYRIKWEKYESANAQPYTVQTWPKTNLPESNRLYGTRLTFQWGEEGVKAGNLSLSLKDVTNDDSGKYTCRIWDGWPCMIEMIVTLKVKDCEVLNPITASPNTTVNLPCTFPSSQGSTSTPEVSWFLGPEQQKHHILQHPPKTSSLDSSGHIPLHGKFRFSGDLNSGNASLSISELSSSDKNWYRCTVSMEGQKNCQEMRLHVKDVSVSEVITTTGRVNVTVKTRSTDWGGHPAKEETSGSPVVAVVSALSVCVAVAVVGSAIFIICRKKTIAVEEDPADAAYANIHTRESACLPSDFYSYAGCEI